MSRILHPTDFSPASRAAFTKAVKVAKKDHSELVIAHVLPPVLVATDGFGFSFVTPPVHAQIEDANRRHGKRLLDALVGRARKAGVRARGLLLEGVVHERILRAARGQHADMIVIGTHGRTGLARFVLGSVATRIVTQAGCPVMTVRGGR